jgi:hypothetical protein
VQNSVADVIRLRRLLVVAFLISLSGLIAQAAEPRSAATVAPRPDFPAWAANQEREPVEWPKELHGSVRNADGRPFADAKILLEIKVQLWVVGGIYEKVVYHQETTTNADGRYAFKTAGFPVIRHRPFDATVTASAPDRLAARSWWWYSPRDKKGESHFGTLTLKSGRAVSGRILDPAGAPVGDAIVQAYDTGARSRRWAPGATKTDKEGRFRLRAPAGDGVGAWVHSTHGAPQFVKFPDDAGEIEVKLERGTSVEGTLLSKDLKPCAGVVVGAESFYDGAFRAYHLPFRLAARTDREGRFHFPPLAGEYRFFVTEASDSMDARGALESNTAAPSVIPKMENLAGSDSRRITLYAGDSATIDGTVRWDDGGPAVGSTVVATMMPAGNGPGFKLAQGVTDQNGRYQLRLPEFVERLLVQVDMERRNDKSFRAVTADGKDSIQLQEVSSRGHHIDFTFRP